MQPEQNATDLLTVEEFHVRTTMGKRLANYLVDIIVFYIIMVIAGVVLALVAPTAIDLLVSDNAGVGVNNLISLVLYAVYMSVIETIFKGKSFGKFLTRTRAVNLDGSRIGVSTAFARGFSRAVPFAVFSALGTPCNPWQDKWTNTMVVDDNTGMQ